MTRRNGPRTAQDALGGDNGGSPPPQWGAIWVRAAEALPALGNVPRFIPVYAFEVFGMPGPQGSKRFVGLSKAGRGIMIESSAKVKPWREAVKEAARRAKGDAPALSGPLAVSMVFTLPRPASAPKRRQYPDRKPDLSKLIRSTEDALTDSGLWEDDARVVEYRQTTKVFPGSCIRALEIPGVSIHIWTIT